MIIALIIAGAAAAVTASADLSRLAALDVSRAVSGEPWRLVSGHLAHLTWKQYVVDTVAFVLLFTTCQRRAGWGCSLLLTFFAALSVSGAVIYRGMHQVYGGLSGLSCATLSTLLLLSVLERPRQVAPYLAGFLFCIYLTVAGESVSGVKVAHEAHLAGAATGIVFVLTRQFLCGPSPTRGEKLAGTADGA